MHNQILRNLYLLASLFICGQSFAHVFAEKPDLALNETAIKNKLQEHNFAILPKELVVKKLKNHNIFLEDLDKINEFSLEDVNSVLAAVSILPEHLNIMFPKVIISIDLHNLKSETAFYNFSISHTESSLGKISLTKNWSSHSFEEKVRTVLHEFGHHFNYVLGDFHFSNFWKNIDGGWESLNGNIKPRFSEKLVSTYAGTSPSEDWAESFVAYVLDQERLKEVSLNKFEFLDRLFSNDLDKDEFKKVKSQLKIYKAKRKKSEAMPLYRDCLNLVKTSNHIFCSNLSVAMLNSRSIQSTLDSSFDNHSSFAFSLFLKTFNQYVKH